MPNDAVQELCRTKLAGLRQLTGKHALSYVERVAFVAAGFVNGSPFKTLPVKRQLLMALLKSGGRLQLAATLLAAACKDVQPTRNRTVEVCPSMLGQHVKVA